MGLLSPVLSARLAELHWSPFPVLSQGKFEGSSSESMHCSSYFESCPPCSNPTPNSTSTSGFPLAPSEAMMLARAAKAAAGRRSLMALVGATPAGRAVRQLQLFPEFQDARTAVASGAPLAKAIASLSRIVDVCERTVGAGTTIHQAALRQCVTHTAVLVMKTNALKQHGGSQAWLGRLFGKRLCGRRAMCASLGGLHAP